MISNMGSSAAQVRTAQAGMEASASWASWPVAVVLVVDRVKRKVKKIISHVMAASVAPWTWQGKEGRESCELMM